MIPDNQRIIDAAILSLHKHKFACERPLRPLKDADFANIRKLRKELAEAWWQQKQLVKDGQAAKVDYREFRSRLLEKLQNSEGWSIATRNLYVSVLAKLTVWDTHGVSNEDSILLAQLLPGAEVTHLQFLHEYQPRLV